MGAVGTQERYRQWSMFAFDPSEKPVVGRPYTEGATADCPPVAAHTLLARMLTPA